MAETTTLDELTVEELRERAKEQGMSGTSHMRKGELIEALDGGKASAGGRTRKSDGTDAIDLLIEDHNRVRTLFESALELEPGDAKAGKLAQQIIAELELHTQVEEQIFYPALKEQAVEDEEDDTTQDVLEAYIEHGGVKDLIAKIQQLDASDESYHAFLKVMSEQVQHHVEEEEGDMFKEAREMLGDERILELGQRIAEAKQQASR